VNEQRDAPAEKQQVTFQNASDLITERLGLDRVEGFSVRHFFSQTFRRHSPDDVENMFTLGAPLTTPTLTPQMGRMPTPWLFFRVLVGAVIVFTLFRVAWLEYGNINVVPGLIIVGSFAVPLAVLILFYELNTPRNVSIVPVAKLVMAGGALSILASLVLYDLAPWLGVFGASAAGIIEETAKLATVVLALRLVPAARYPHRLNGLLFGAALGAGFAAFESAGYALSIGLVDSEAMLDNITLRGVMSPFSHIVWTAMAAGAFWLARGDDAGFIATVRSRRFLQLFSVPVVLHFIWNLPFSGPLMIKYWILGFVAWVIVISLVQSGLREVASIASSEGNKESSGAA
jgi:protease PrsW